MIQRNAQKQLVQAVNTNFILLNPVLELVAVVTSEHQVDVFRFGGQRAFGTRSNRDRASVLAICWKFDGSELAIWWDDNTWQRLDSWTGQAGPTLSFFATDDESISALDFVSWQPKEIDPASSSYTSFLRDDVQTYTRSRCADNVNGFGNQTIASNTDDGNGLDSGIIDSEPEFDTEYLPKLLASFDITSELPRLSSLPQVFDAQLDPDMKQMVTFFTRQELIDTMKDSFKPSVSDSMEFLLVSYDRNHLTIGPGYAYRLANIDASNGSSSKVQRKNLAHISHPLSLCEVFLSSQDQKAGTPLDLRYLLLKPIQDSGIYVPLVNQAVNQLSLLSTYITLSIVAVRDAWTNARDVFSRFIRSIESTLSDAAATATHPEVGIVTALVRLVMTGSYGPELVEWIVEIMGTKGIDRWHTAYTRGLVQLMDLLHSNLLPALDRLSIEASRLRAMCRNPDIPMCQISDKALERILSDADTLRSLANTALIYARQELPQIEAFAGFMRCQFQMMKEPNSTAAKDAVETFAALDHSQLLSFITGAMTKSHLNVFFGRETAMIRKAPRRPKQSAPKKIILSMLERHATNPLQPMSPVVEFVNLLYQSFFLADSVNEVQGEAIALFEKRVTLSNAISLGSRLNTDTIDMRMWFLEDKFTGSNRPSLSSLSKERMVTCVAGVSAESQAKVMFYTYLHKAVGPFNDPPHTEQILREGSATIKGHAVLDLKFITNHTIILLLRGERDGAHMLVKYPAFRTLLTENSLNDTVISDIEEYIIHTFQTESGSAPTEAFHPVRLQVPKIPEGSATKVLLVDATEKRYEVYDIKDMA